MPEDLSSAGAQSTGTESQASNAGAEAATTATTEQSARTTSAPSANQLIKAFANERGVTVETLLDQIKQSESDNKTQLTTLQQQVTDLTKGIETEKANARAALVDSALTSAATSAGARSTRAIVAMLRDSVELDDKGNPKGVKEAIEALKAEDPGLFKHADGRGDGGRQGVESTGDINAALRELADQAR